MTIYVTQETNHDLHNAERFGEIVFITNRDLSNHKTSMHNVDMLLNIRDMLAKYDPAKDFILPVGSPYVQAAVFWVFGRMGFDTCHILRWSNRDKIYTPVKLQLPFGHHQ